MKDVFDDWDEWERRERENDTPEDLKTIKGYPEEWKTIDNFPDYEVSIYGEVYDKKREKFSTIHSTDRGYSFVVLQKDGKSYAKKVHRLVAEAFIPNPSNKPEINHKDAYKGNNRLTNLEWATRAENMEHASKMGLIKGCYNRGSFPKKSIIIVELNKKFVSVADCAKFIGGSAAKIGQCASGKRSTHMGYHYKYI